MAKVSNDISDLKRLLGSDSPVSAEIDGHKKESDRTSDIVQNKCGVYSDEDILHSYIQSVLNSSEVYDIMKDTAIEGVSFRALANTCQDQSSKDIVDYFACCFFEGEYSLLDVLAVQCENGNIKSRWLMHQSLAMSYQ